MKVELILSLIFRSGMVVCNFLAVAVLSKKLGLEDYGYWAAWVSIISWLAIIEISLGSSFKNYAVNTVKSASKKLMIEKFSYLNGAVLVLALVLFLASTALFSILDYESKYFEIAKSFIPIYILSLCFTMFTSLSYVLDKGYLSFLQQFILIFISVCVFFLYEDIIEEELSLDAVAFIYSVSYLISFSMLAIYWSFQFKAWLIKLSFRSLEVISELCRMSMKFFMVQLLYIALFASDRIIISMFSTGEEVSYYDYPSRILSLMYMVVAVYVSLSWTKVSDIIICKNDILLVAYIKKSMTMLLVLSVAFWPFVIFMDELVSFWVSSDPEFSLVPVAILLFLSVIIQSYGALTAVMFNASGKVMSQVYVTIFSIFAKCIIFLTCFWGFGYQSYISAAVSTMLALLIWSVYSTVRLNNRKEWLYA